MAEQVIELSVGPGNSCLSPDGKQTPVAVKKTPLRDLPNENNVLVSKSTGVFVIAKEEETSTDGARVSGIKRPCIESQGQHSHHKSPGSNSVNGHLVYVRRKSETEANKNNTDEAIVDNNNNNNGDCSKSKQIMSSSVMVEEQSQVQESRMQCFSAFAPMPNASLLSSSSGKPSVPTLIRKPVTESVPAESHPHLGDSSVPPTSDQKKISGQNWEERYFQLQMFLKKLDQSGLEEYIQKLRALSPAELNRYAVELEKRTMQLAVEEGVELQRVRALDVLGKIKGSGQSSSSSTTTRV